MFDVNEWLKRQDIYEQEAKYLNNGILLVRHKESGDWFKLKYADQASTKYLLSQETLWLRRSSRCQPVKCYLSESKADYQLLIMDYLKGKSVSELLKVNPNKVNEQDIMLSLFHNIKNLHEQGIIHNDIKPSNIIVKDKVVNLIDFASSGWINQKYASKQYQSYTLAFSLPECYLRESFQPISDWYAFFLMLDLLKTGEVLALSNVNINDFVRYQEQLIRSYQFVNQIEKNLIKQLNSIA
jgi:serine/threonine protein kinase